MVRVRLRFTGVLWGNYTISCEAKNTRRHFLGVSGCFSVFWDFEISRISRCFLDAFLEIVIEIPALVEYYPGARVLMMMTANYSSSGHTANAGYYTRSLWTETAYSVYKPGHRFTDYSLHMLYYIHTAQLHK